MRGPCAPKGRPPRTRSATRHPAELYTPSPLTYSGLPDPFHDRTVTVARCEPNPARNANVSTSARECREYHALRLER